MNLKCDKELLKCAQFYKLIDPECMNILFIY